MKPISILTGLSLLLATAASAYSQATTPSLDALTNEWRAEHGAPWRVIENTDTGYARMLWGYNTPAAQRPRSDRDFVGVARDFAAQAAPLFGLEPSTLFEDSTHLIPLATVGGTDKMSVVFRQEVNGVPVKDGWNNMLLGMDGRLLAMDFQGLPGVAGMDTIPSTPADVAVAFAIEQFRAETGTPVNAIEDLGLVIDREGATGVLAHQVSIWYREDGMLPDGFRYTIAAQGEPRVISKENLVHHDVGGNVQAMASPGTLPDKASNPETALPMKYMKVTSSLGTIYTDANGDFNYPGASGPVSITFQFDGTYNNVRNQSGTDYILTQSLSGTGNAVLMNPSSSTLVTAQANAFNSINAVRDWTVNTDPSDTKMNGSNRANVNLNANCNAYFDGSSTNYYTAGGGCVNTAYSTVVAHEQGHWQNVRYSTGNGNDGMGEGNGDVFAMYVYNTPYVGEDFCGTGCDIRSGLNNRQFCGDGNGGCYGEVHADGEVWMGAAWKVRRNIQLSLGTGPGGDVADALFLGWMNGYNQTTIRSIIETQWLTLDDDNGNILDGTPNYQDIDDAFTQQGFPGVVVNNPYPDAQFVGNPTTGFAPLFVAFTDQSTGDGLSAWSWDFGDGGSSSAQNPGHTYVATGTYNVTLTVTGTLGVDDEVKNGYIVVTQDTVATVTPRNGSGVNPNIFSTVNLPVLGTTWSSQINGGSIGAAGLTFMVGYSAPLNGIITGYGELLVDTTSPWLFTSIAGGGGGISNHAVAIPNDPALLGFLAYTQGFLNNVGGSSQLTNALDLVLGH